MTKLTFEFLKKEICKREVSEHREVNITDVKRVMRHMLDVLGEYPLIQQARNGDGDGGLWELELQMGAGVSFIAGEVSKRQDERMKKMMAESKSRKAGEGK